MPGICGVVGKEQPQSLSTDVLSFDRTYQESYSDDLLSISSITHNSINQPVESDNGSFVWIWGDVYSHKSESGEYVPKRSHTLIQLNLSIVQIYWTNLGSRLLNV